MRVFAGDGATSGGGRGGGAEPGGGVVGSSGGAGRTDAIEIGGTRPLPVRLPGVVGGGCVAGGCLPSPRAAKKAASDEELNISRHHVDSTNVYVRAST